MLMSASLLLVCTASPAVVDRMRLVASIAAEQQSSIAAMR